MYKFTAILLSLLLIASLSACGGTGGAPSSSSEEASVSGEIGGEITVTAYDTMNSKAFLEDAARLFEEKYPGTKVNVETFSAMPEIKTSEQGNMKLQMVEENNDPQSRQDYINKINTAMMSGEGADVLAMDVLPVDKYVENGNLENLDSYMESDPEFNRADYRENILDAIRYKNGTWFLPLNYTFSYYAYDSTLLDGSAFGFGTGGAFTTEKLIELAKPAFDGSVKMFNSIGYTKGSRGVAGGMWSSLLDEKYGYFVDSENKTANFNDGTFVALLESVRQYGEDGYIPQGINGQTDPDTVMQRAGESPSDRFFFKSKNIFSLTSQFTRDLGVKMNFMTSGASPAFEDDDEIAGIVANANGAVPFTYGQAYAINSNSKNKETAWAFVKFLLGEETQLGVRSVGPTSLPLLNSARAKNMENFFSNMGGQRGPRMMQGSQTNETRQGPPQENQQQGGQPQEQQQLEPLDEKLLEALAKYNEAVEQLSDQINTYVFKDTIIEDMIMTEAQYFFEGSKTADEVADMLQSKVSLYLNE